MQDLGVASVLRRNECQRQKYLSLENIWKNKRWDFGQCFVIFRWHGEVILKSVLRLATLVDMDILTWLDQQLLNLNIKHLSPAWIWRI